MDTKSQQLMMDIWCDKDISPYVEKLKEYVDKHFSVVLKQGYKFEPQGETVVYVLSESHFALHTYPENNYITLDIYICNLSIDLTKTKNDIESICDPKKVNFKIIKRGFEEGIDE